MRQDQYYDKMISRMDKMCGSLDKIAKMLEAMQKAEAFRNATMLALSDIDGNATATLYKYAEGEKEEICRRDEAMTGYFVWLTGFVMGAVLVALLNRFF